MVGTCRNCGERTILTTERFCCSDCANEYHGFGPDEIYDFDKEEDAGGSADD